MIEKKLSKQIENESWAKLEHIFNSLNEKNISMALEQFGVKEICLDGITSVINGEEKVQELCFGKLLIELGFTFDQQIEPRLCVIGDCKFTSPLHDMLNHFIGYHNVPAQNIGRLISVIKNDARKLPSKIERLKYNFSNPQMSTD